MKQPIRISVIIPVYNEERHLGACLDALAAQTVQPTEVIVVDNNSTDRSAAIARSYPFVKVLSEDRQGQVFARNRGFDASSGDIIARLDGDVVPAPDWVEQIRGSFADQELQAVTGLAYANLLPRADVGYSRLWMQMYLWWGEAFFGVTILCGANLALRRSMWQRVRPETCDNNELVHEDQDLSLLIAAQGGAVRTNKRMLITMDDRSHHEWGKFRTYVLQRWRTKRYHQTRGTFLEVAQHGTLLSPTRRAMRWAAVVLPGLPFVASSFYYGLVGAFKLRLSTALNW